MATINRYGPYQVSLGFGDIFGPGEVRTYTFGSWPPFGDAVVTVSVHPHRDQFSEKSIRLESIVSRKRPNGEHFIDCSYRNTGSGIKFWYLYLCLVSP